MASVCLFVCLFVSQETGLYEYKTVGLMADLDPEACAQVYVDWEYRKAWDTYVLGKQVFRHTVYAIVRVY